MDALSEWFTLYLLDRRGRGASLRESISGPVFYLGHSYGALIGMETLLLTNNIAKALLYEPPFDTPGHTLVPESFFDTFSGLLTDGEREQALELFYTDIIGIDPHQSAHSRSGKHASQQFTHSSARDTSASPTAATPNATQPSRPQSDCSSAQTAPQHSRPPPRPRPPRYRAAT